MNFLLVGINAKYIHSNPAIYSLAAFAEQYRDQDGNSLKEDICLAEYTINQNTEDILMDIYLKRPDVIAFSCYIWNIEVVYKILDELHKLLPRLPIWLGGPEVSYQPEQLLKERPFITGIMVGEGEETFAELVRKYADYFKNKQTAVTEKSIPDCSFQDIRGIVTAEYHTGMRECLDLNRIPFFYNDLSGFQNRIVYYESSRGCPFRCSYCLSSIEKSVRFRNTDLVKKELQFFLEHQVPQVKFIDRTFNAHHEHAMTIWNYIKKQDNGITNFHFEISADLLNEEELALLNTLRPGLVQLEIGVQSTNPDTIQAINRSMNLDKLGHAVEKIRQAENIHEHLDLIAGLPFEDYESFHHSFNDVYALQPNQLQLGFLKVLKGAKMYEEAEKYGIVFSAYPPYEVLYTKWLTYEDTIRLKRIEAMVELFYNTNQFRSTIHFLEQAFVDAFTMYEELAEFYEKKGFLTMSQKRIYQYEILLEFAKEQDEKNLPIYRELLTLDVYLRENMKTRPEFAPNQETYKEVTRSIYQKEAAERSLLPDYVNRDAKQLAKMTHMEFFNYPVWEKNTEKAAEKLIHAQGVIFNYEKRNPLTEDAELIFV